jgi:hypothetical protein
MFVDYHADDILRAIRKQVAHGKYERSPLFGDGSAGKRIADVLATAELRIQKRLAYPTS